MGKAVAASSILWRSVYAKVTYGMTKKIPGPRAPPVKKAEPSEHEKHRGQVAKERNKGAERRFVVKAMSFEQSHNKFKGQAKVVKRRIQWQCFSHVNWPVRAKKAREKETDTGKHGHIQLDPREFVCHLSKWCN